MTILELLKLAIEEKDFRYVVDAIEMISGESVSIEEEDPVKEKIREIEDILAALKSGQKEKPKTKKKPQKKVVHNDEDDEIVETDNEFDKIINDLDILPEPGEHLINDKVKRERKTRPPSTKNVKCSQCGKEEEVSSVLARDNYKCQRCLIKMAKR